MTYDNILSILNSLRNNFNKVVNFNTKFMYNNTITLDKMRDTVNIYFVRKESVNLNQSVAPYEIYIDDEKASIAVPTNNSNYLQTRIEVNINKDQYFKLLSICTDLKISQQEYIENKVLSLIDEDL
jgi:hypothetical protein